MDGHCGRDGGRGGRLRVKASSGFSMSLAILGAYTDTDSQVMRETFMLSVSVAANG